MKTELVAALDRAASAAAVVEANVPIGDMLPLLRAVRATMILVLAEPELVEIDRDMLAAAIPSLAKECAPDARIALLDVAPGAEVDAVVAAGLFLAAAESTTGQVLRISARN